MGSWSEKQDASLLASLKATAGNYPPGQEPTRAEILRRFSGRPLLREGLRRLEEAGEISWVRAGRRCFTLRVRGQLT